MSGVTKKKTQNNDKNDANTNLSNDESKKKVFCANCQILLFLNQNFG